MAVDASISDRLAELERASAERRTELDALLVELPAATSRRALVRAAVGDLVHAPNKGEIAGRALRKLLRAPSALVRRIRRR